MISIKNSIIAIVAGFAFIVGGNLTGNQVVDSDTHPIDQLIAQYYGTGPEPGLAFMVVKNGDVVYQHTSGIANLNTGEAITAQSNFRLASVTKQMTALAVLMLSDRGNLDLDAPLTDYFRGFPCFGRGITPRMLIHHTSGLLEYESLGPLLEPDKLERIISGQEQIVDADVLEVIMKTDRTHFTPGTEFRYSNTGYALLALLVEQASGTSFPKFLKSNIFEPLGMENTLVYAHDDVEIPHRAYGHSKTENGWKVTDQNETSAVLGDGGVYSSIDDMKKWFAFLDGHTTLNLSEQAYKDYFSSGFFSDGSEITIKPRPGNANSTNLLIPRSYGYGWMIGEYGNTRTHHHGGASIGFRHMLFRSSKAHLYVVVLTNRNEAYEEFDELAFRHFVEMTNMGSKD